jgi:hypothetical protein
MSISTDARSRVRWGGVAFALAGVCFFLYPALRTWRDESTAGGALEAISANSWLLTHTLAMIGFILVPLGLAAVWAVVADTPAERSAFAALVTTWVGAGLTLPFYGAETYALNAIASLVAEGGDHDLLVLKDAIQNSPLAITTFAIGLILLAIGGVVAAVAIWRSNVLPRYSGVPLAVGFSLFLPQFFTPAPVRISHGVLMAAGLFWLAVVVRRAADSTSGQIAQGRPHR